jgi:hypothetical protein
MNVPNQNPVMVVLGTTIHEYPAETATRAPCKLQEDSPLAHKLVDGRTKSDHDEKSGGVRA